ncbi:MAG: TadE/TadG family type IV pilus assembly protein [Phycisphaerales bacterium]
MVRIREKNRHRGLAMLEVAVVFPLLLLISLGAIRYGWMFLKAQQITNATRHGARIAILPGVTEQDDVLPAIKSLMESAGIQYGDYSVTISPNPVSSAAAGDTVTVQVTVPFNKIDIMDIPLFTDLEPANWNLGATVTMAKEGPFTVIP